MRHRAARSLMTHCPFHCTLDEAVGLSAGVNTNRQHPRVSQGPLAPAKTRAGGGGGSLVWLSEKPHVVIMCDCWGHRAALHRTHPCLELMLWGGSLLWQLVDLVEKATCFFHFQFHPRELFFFNVVVVVVFSLSCLGKWSGRCTIWHESHRRRAEDLATPAEHHA